MPNEFGDYLPEDDADLEEESERIQAPNKLKAEKICARVAKEYGGIDPRVEPLIQGLFDCKFQVWRSRND